MSWAAVISSETRVSTRSVVVCPSTRVFCWNRAVADAPELAAVGCATVSSVMVFLLIRKRTVGSAVLAVVGEFAFVDVDSEPRTFADRQHAVLDLQRLGEQVVGHVEEVGQFGGTARCALERRGEGEAAQRTDLTVDLVSHHHLDAQSLAETEHALRVGETRAGRLDTDSAGGAVQQLPDDFSWAGRAFVGENRDGAVRDQPAPVEDVVGRAGLLSEGQIEIGQRTQGPGRFAGGPTPVGG